MNIVVEGLSAFTEPLFWLYLGIGVGLGLLVGMFPGVTMTMAVALASGFTLTLDYRFGLAVLLGIYVAGNFGDRIPAILINTPGTPASIATTLDGYPMARDGRAGLALFISACATALGILASITMFVLVARPVASFALRFGPAEMFALVVFGLAVMISIASRSLIKGLLAGLLGLALAVIGRDPITGDARFTFGVNELSSGLTFIAVIIGLFGIAEVLDQMLTHRPARERTVAGLGRWRPNRQELHDVVKPSLVGGGVGIGVGIVPAAGGDIAGLVAWDRARALSRTPEKFGTGHPGGVAATDTAIGGTLGGSLTTTMALGIPGDSVMAVMIGSMIVWGIQPGPSLFTNRPDMVVLIAGIMLAAMVVALVLSLVRTKAMVKVLDIDPRYLWALILVFCMVGTYATTNSTFTVSVMTVFGFLGLALKRAGIPAGPVVLGLLLGPLAEGNLRRALVIGGPETLVTRPIAAVLLLLAVAVLVSTVWRARHPRALPVADGAVSGESLAVDGTGGPTAAHEPSSTESAPEGRP